MMERPPASEPLKLSTVADPERLVLSRGNVFSVTTASGDICPPGARELGVFHQDTRHLSHYELVLPHGSPTKLSSDAVSAVLAQVDLTATEVELGGLLEEPINFLHVRRKQLLDDDFLDQLVFTNHLRQGVDVEFELRFAGDFADIFEVRGARREVRGTLLPALVGDDRVELRYRGRGGLMYHTLLRFVPEPSTLLEDRARFRMHLEPGEAQVQQVAITPYREGDAPRDLEPFDVRVARGRVEAKSFRRRSTGMRCENRIFLAALERGISDMYALRILHEGQWIVGGGIPWYAAPFGRDALIASAEVLGFAPALAGETLRFLARWQGQKEDPEREEEPGKIMHELRRGEMALLGEIPHNPYYGTIDATPLYVILAGETWRWTADRGLLQTVWPHVKAAMAWVDRRTENGTRFLEYQRHGRRGLENHGWKDSRDGVCFPDGRHARSPIALVEVQGYVVDAYRQASRLAEVMGESELAATWAGRLEPFRSYVEERFWNDETRFYALALDGDGRQVPTLSSNPGHLLWSRAVAPERAARVADVLLSPEMYSGWGIRTVARGQPVYNPISYHNGTVWPHDNAIAALGMARYGLHDQAMRVLAGLFAASRSFPHLRLPELFCGMARGEHEFLVKYPVSCSPQAWAAGSLFMVLQGALGLDPDAQRGRLRIWNPRLPPGIRRFDLRRMQIGASRVSLRFAREGSRTHADVLEVRGAPLRVEIEIG
jgi:glycogen debranching enzyme